VVELIFQVRGRDGEIEVVRDALGLGEFRGETLR
jgi:hypothetical protein